MLDHMVSFVNEKSQEMMQESIDQFLKDSPASLVDDELKALVLERATSQLMFGVGELHMHASADTDDQLDAWYDEERRENLKKACARCIKEEMDKRSKNGKTNLTILEKYLLEHGISLDESNL